MTKEKVKNEKKGNSKILIVSVIAVLLVVVLVGTYAYFASRTEVSNTLNVVANIEHDNGTFITTATKIDLNVTSASMQEGVKGNIAVEENGVLNVEYLSGTENGITCKYDINYEWVSENNTNPYTITNILKPEFTYEITDGSNTIISERNFVASSDRNKHKLGTGYIYNADTTNSTIKNYTINAKFYNIDEDQSLNADKNWTLKFYVDNVVCGVDVESTYTLSGVLLDDNNNPISNATLVAFSEPIFTTTDENGRFEISGLEEENHNIYFVPGKSIVEIGEMSQNEISTLPGVIGGAFNLQSTGTISMSNNYSISTVDIEEIPLNSQNGNNSGGNNNNGGSSSGTEGTLITTLKSEAGTNETNDFGNWAIINQEVTVNEETVAAYNLSSNTYVNTIYVGKNPDNYVTFNGELWRIIGVYNEDTHGMSGQQLIKIIKNDNIRSESATDIATIWDYKQNGLGSSSDKFGSNEWSDSQLMFMLNGSSAINKGKLYNGSAMSEYTTSVDGDYIVDKNSYNIFKGAGSYLTTNRETNKSVYIPASATTSSLTETTGTLSSTLSSSALSMVEEVVWHLGGPDTYNDTTKNTAAGYYTYERGNQVWSGSGVKSSTTSTVRSTTWQGLIGLMYPSDYGYATSGGSTYNRSTCLGYQMYGWKDESYQTDCADNSWLLYTNSTSSSEGTKEPQWTITPRSSSANGVSFVYNGSVSSSYARYAYVVRPVLYLKNSVNITSGDGSYDNPYELTM